MVIAETADTVSSAVPDQDQPQARVGRWTASELQAAYLGDVYRYVSRRLPRREDAEDATAEVFAAAFQALPRFRGQCEPRLWLLGIARRKVADALRRKRRMPEALASEQETVAEVTHEVADATLSAEGSLQRDEERTVVRSIIAPGRALRHYREVLSI